MVAFARAEETSTGAVKSFPTLCEETNDIPEDCAEEKEVCMTRTRRKRAWQRVGASTAVLAILLTLALPALAVSGEAGILSCGTSKPYSYVQWRTKGIWREVTPPGASTIHYGNQPAGMWISGVHQGVYGGGYWDILSSNDTDTVYTKGYCQNFG